MARYAGPHLWGAGLAALGAGLTCGGRGLAVWGAGLTCGGGSSQCRGRASGRSLAQPQHLKSAGWALGSHSDEHWTVLVPFRLSAALPHSRGQMDCIEVWLSFKLERPWPDPSHIWKSKF